MLQTPAFGHERELWINQINFTSTWEGEYQAGNIFTLSAKMTDSIWTSLFIATTIIKSMQELEKYIS